MRGPLIRSVVQTEDIEGLVQGNRCLQVVVDRAVFPALHEARDTPGEIETPGSLALT